MNTSSLLHEAVREAIGLSITPSIWVFLIFALIVAIFVFIKKAGSYLLDVMGS